MQILWNGSYTSTLLVGVANALIHWQLFFLLTVAGEFSQAFSNLAAFAVAGCFSLYAHVLYTFETRATVGWYLLFTAFLGVMSFVIGNWGDREGFSGVLTVGLFTFFSLICGLLLTWFVSIRERQR